MLVDFFSTENYWIFELILNLIEYFANLNSIKNIAWEYFVFVYEWVCLGEVPYLYVCTCQSLTALLVSFTYFTATMSLKRFFYHDKHTQTFAI